MISQVRKEYRESDEYSIQHALKLIIIIFQNAECDVLAYIKFQLAIKIFDKYCT